MIKMKERADWIVDLAKIDSTERVSRAIDVIMELQKDLTTARRTVAFFSSMISSGEMHTDESIKMLEAAMGAGSEGQRQDVRAGLPPQG